MTSSLSRQAGAVALYMLTSVALVFFNKAALRGFPCPLSLTWLQMLVTLPLVLAVLSSGARDLTLSRRGGGTGSKGTTVGSFSDEPEEPSESHALTGDTAFGCAPGSVGFVLRALSTAGGPASGWLEPSGPSIALSRAVNCSYQCSEVL